MKCPICQYEIAPPRLHVELGENDTAWSGDLSVALTPIQAEAAFVVAGKHGEFASIEDIMRGLYGRSWEDYDPESLPTLFSRVRYRIRHIGATILSGGPRGYAARLINGCYCVRERVAAASKEKQQRRVQTRKWEGAILRRIAVMLNKGHSFAEIAGKIGETKNSVTGGIQRNRAEIAELRAHEARQSMGHR